MNIGFGIGINYPNTSVVYGVIYIDEENTLRFNDNTDILWEDESKILIEE